MSNSIQESRIDAYMKKWCWYFLDLWRFVFPHISARLLEICPLTNARFNSRITPGIQLTIQQYFKTWTGDWPIEWLVPVFSGSIVRVTGSLTFYFFNIYMQKPTIAGAGPVQVAFSTSSYWLCTRGLSCLVNWVPSKLKKLGPNSLCFKSPWPI